MDAAKALMLSDKLQWIPEKCNRASFSKKRRPKKTKGKGTKHHKKSKKHVSKYNMMGGKRRSKRRNKSKRNKKYKKSKQRSKKR